MYTIIEREKEREKERGRERERERYENVAERFSIP
jgi:hypothetical protein